MFIQLKEMSPKAKEISVGSTNLSDGLLKKTLLCRTGQFSGMFGPVTVTSEMLSGLAEKYNKDRSNPQNENDYAPILKDHERKVDNVLGRLMADLYVEDWSNPENGEVELGLYGNLRIDDEEAKKNVESGKYAHVSISFDEETLELYEVSFVSVEAARRSIILSHKQGEENMSKNVELRLSTLAQKHHALAATIQAGRQKRKVALGKLTGAKEGTETSFKAVETALKEMSQALKTAQVKAKMLGFVQAGKMTPAELKELDLVSLSALDAKTMGIVLSSYEKRPVSPDVVQFGQSGGKLQTKDVTNKEAMREAIELQRAGKKANVSLSVVPDEDKEKEAGDKKLAADGMNKEGEHKEEHMGMDHEEFAKVLAQMEACHSQLKDLHAKLSEMHKASGELAEGEDKDEKEEKQHLAADEDGKVKEGEKQ